jgi:hypothetical protein
MNMNTILTITCKGQKTIPGSIRHIWTFDNKLAKQVTIMQLVGS